MSDEGYSGTKTAAIVGITYRQLDYWTRTGLVRPSLTDAGSTGSNKENSKSPAAKPPTWASQATL